MKKTNMHIHSKYSWDCELELENITKRLIALDIYYAGICDHIEFDREASIYVLEKFRIRNLEIDELNDKYKGKIKILKGAEISSPHLYPSKVEDLRDLNFDYLMGSIHKINKKVMTKEERIEATADYYEEVLKMVEANQVDIIGHIDYINRYYGEDYSDKEAIKEIFEIIKENNQVIELNTSAARRTNDYYISFPNLDKLAMYSGIKKEITIGTDAHELEELNDSLDENSIVVEQLSLEPVIYEKRKMIKL